MELIKMPVWRHQPLGKLSRFLQNLHVLKLILTPEDVISVESFH